MKTRTITTWEAACIITGYGIGGGVLAMPYLAARNGIFISLVILVLAFAGSYALHLMIADIALKTGAGCQIVAVFSRFLFRGKLKNLLTVLFFALMAVVLCANLAAYIAGSADVIVGILPISPLLAKLLFYVFAAVVVLFGLKAVAVSEKIMVAVIFALIGVLAVFSVLRGRNPIPVAMGSLRDMTAYFGMAMLAFAAFFSVPQVVEGLGGDEKEIKKAVFLGLNNNFVLMIVVIFCALLASEEITEVGMVGWSAGIGTWAQIVGSIFTLVAMLTTYWSISLALGDIVKEQTRWNSKLCWVLATVPSMLVALLNLGSFLDFLEIAGGAIAIIVAIMVVPCYRNARKEIPGSILGKADTGLTMILVVIAYVLMAVGNLV